MNSEENRKRLERQARSLILTKEISPEDRDKVNVFMRNQNISQEERYTNIINLLKRAPDKEIIDLEDDDEESKGIKKVPVLKKNGGAANGAKQITGVQYPARKFPDINGPTETKLYINDIYLKFKRYRFFKKRYLARRDNRFGIGLSKRLIPAKKFLSFMKEIKTYQEIILSRLPQILERILKDESIDTPYEFNYLRLLRRWMIISPFSSTPYDRIKWMEQWDFERELRAYVIYFHTFLRMDNESRDQVFSLVEKILREEPDLLKEDLIENEDRWIAVQKENENYRKEKIIFEYLGALRSFMAIHGEADSLLAAFIKKKYDIVSLEEVINISLEALVFQRPFTGSELREYFEIRPPAVSRDVWDLNNARLKIYGKDPESKRRKQAEKLKRDLFWYDTIYQILKIDDNGQNLLVRSVEEQWKYIDHINRDAEESYKNNFIVFLEGVVLYFKNLITPLLNGSPLFFESNGNPVEGAIFSHDFFFDEIKEIELLAANIYSFRNNNPTLKISEEEIKKIIAGRISSMNHVEGIVFKTGSSFYALGNRLQEVYHNHIGSYVKEKNSAVRNIPLSPDDNASDAVIPFSEYSLKGFEPYTPLLKRITGRRILSDTMKGGLIVFIMAYCYQAAYICCYPQIQNDMGRRDALKKQINDLEGEVNDSKR